MPENANQSEPLALRYVRQWREQAVPDDQIRKQALERGFSAFEVENAFRALQRAGMPAITSTNFVGPDKMPRAEVLKPNPWPKRILAIFALLVVGGIAVLYVMKPELFTRIQEELLPYLLKKGAGWGEWLDKTIQSFQ